MIGERGGFRLFLCAALLSVVTTACVPSTRDRPVSSPSAKAADKPSVIPPPSRPTPSRTKAALSPDLQSAIHDAWINFPGTTGIAVFKLDGGGQVGERMDQLFPQQSVSKLWVAMTVLDQVDRGILRLDQNVRITKNDLAVFHQPIRDRVLANGEVNETIRNLLLNAITASDNTANDSLLRTAGGPEAVQKFLLSKNLGNIRFGPGERALQSAIAGLKWQQDYAIGRRFYAARDALPYRERKASLDRYLANPIDGASPGAIVNALARLAKGDLLSTQSTGLMLAYMGQVKSGPNRLKAGVPGGWSFVHKTGTGQDLPPVSTGYNDVGIMTAPDGSRYAVAVMLADTTASVPERMAFMQSISRLVANYHLK